MQQVRQLHEQSASYTEQHRTYVHEMQKLSEKQRVLYKQHLDETQFFHRKHMRAWYFRALQPQVVFAERQVLFQRHLTELNDIFEQHGKLVQEQRCTIYKHAQVLQQLQAVESKMVNDVTTLSSLSDIAAVELLMCVPQAGGDAVSAQPHLPTPNTRSTKRGAYEVVHGWVWKPMQ